VAKTTIGDLDVFCEVAGLAQLSRKQVGARFKSAAKPCRKSKADHIFLGTQHPHAMLEFAVLERGRILLDGSRTAL
jgi:hypothetical protein